MLKPYKRPSQAARPAGIAPISLLRGLPQKFAGLQIEDPFVRGGSVPAHQEAARGEAVAQRDIPQPPVARFARGVEDDADVHHDVDEDRILGHERSQILAIFLEPHGQRRAGLNDDVFQLRIAAIRTSDRTSA